MNENNYKKSITGLIISAGLSSRIGKYKPLLNYSGKSFLNNIAEKLSLVCDKIIIVTGHNSDLVRKHISEWQSELKSKISIVHNPDYERGMFTSLKRGVEENSSDWILYHFVDQPNLPGIFYEKFIMQIDKEFNWIQPMFNGRKGHPVLFNKNVISQINKEINDSSLRAISQSDKILKKYWLCHYKSIFTDVDTWKDLEELNKEGQND